MNCLTNAIVEAQSNQKLDATPHSIAYQKLVKQSERQKLARLFEAGMVQHGFTIRKSGMLYDNHGPFVIFPEWKFWEGRKFAFDYAWPGLKLAVEIEGGVWRKGGGAHSHPTNIMRDIEKNNAAVLLGWRVLRFTDYHLKSPYYLECVQSALKGG